MLTVADQAADASGLWLADYDLLARMPGLERLDLIATENVLAAGFHERVHDVLPGIEEERWGGAAAVPVIAAPESPAADPLLWSVSRDREEELAALARSIKRGAPEISNGPRWCFNVRCRTCISPGRCFPTRRFRTRRWTRCRSQQSRLRLHSTSSCRS